MNAPDRDLGAALAQLALLLLAVGEADLQVGQLTLHLLPLVLHVLLGRDQRADLNRQVRRLLLQGLLGLLQGGLHLQVRRDQ